LDWKFPLKSYTIHANNVHCGLITKLEDGNEKEFPYLNLDKLIISSIGKNISDIIKYELQKVKYYWSIPLKIRFDELKYHMKTLFASMKPSPSTIPSTIQNLNSTQNLNQSAQNST